MSQYPPPGPPGYPPPNPPGFPPGFPPAGAQGFGPPGYSMPPNTRTSGAAVASLVCGLLFCIPGLTGLIALITGIVGIATTSNPAVRGRGMAIAGLILGIFSLGGWSAVVIFGAGMYQHSAPDRAFAQQYIADLAAGKIDQCVQNSTANVAQQQLQADYTQLQAWGTFQTAKAFPKSWNYDNGKSTIEMQGVAVFTGSAHNFMIVVETDSGTKKIDSFQWIP